MANFVSRFVPNMSKLSAPLRSLTEQDNEWVWDPVHEKSFQDVKEAIDHMQISAPFCFGCGRHIERSFAGSEPHSVQVRLHCRVSEFWSHCNVLQELGDSRLSFLRHMHCQQCNDTHTNDYLLFCPGTWRHSFSACNTF